VVFLDPGSRGIDPERGVAERNLLNGDRDLHLTVFAMLIPVS
jgi:hypothetical protein